MITASPLKMPALNTSDFCNVGVNSQIASKMSVFIIRAFVRLREMAFNNEKLARKVQQLENRVSDHDEILLDLIEEIKKIIDAPKPGKKNVVGFISANGKKKKK